MKHITTLFIYTLLSVTLNAQNLDIHLLRQINTPHELVADKFFRGVSNSTFFISIGTPLTMMVAGEIRYNPKLLKTSCVLIVSTAATFVITDVLKHVVNRQRPFVIYKDVLNKSRVVTLDPSFPSGHTSSAFNTATFLSLTHPRWYIILPSFAWAGTVAYSRMYLGVHYPSDVIAGAVIGAGTAYLTHIVWKQLNKK